MPPPSVACLSSRSRKVVDAAVHRGHKMTTHKRKCVHLSCRQKDPLFLPAPLHLHAALQNYVAYFGDVGHSFFFLIYIL